MHAPHKFLLISSVFALLVLLFSLETVADAAPTANAPAPDYGGRESSPLAASDAPPNPAAQAGRALEALVVVLVGAAGVVYVLKRFHLVKPGVNGQPTFGRSASSSKSEVLVVSSQTLPGGTMLHVVQVDGKKLLLAATPQTVTTVTEWAVTDPEPAATVADFEEYLNRADPASGIAAANARLRSLLTPQQPEE